MARHLNEPDDIFKGDIRPWQNVSLAINQSTTTKVPFKDSSRINKPFINTISTFLNDT